MPEQKLTWEQNIRRELNAFLHTQGEITAEKKEEFIAKIKATAKPELEKAFLAGTRQEDIPPPHDFETWYQNTYNK